VKVKVTTLVKVAQDSPANVAVESDEDVGAVEVVWHFTDGSR